MKACFPLILLLCTAAASCDKIKDLAAQAQKKTQEKMEKVTKTAPSTAKPVSTADMKLQAMVDQTTEGVVFRKDLPFPTKLEVSVIEKQTYKNALTFSSSELGRQSTRTEGVLTTDFSTKRMGNQLTITLGKKVITRNNPEKPDEPITEVVQDGKAGKSIRLNLNGKNWQPETGADFHSRVWADQIRGHADELLIDAGVIPRSLWFGKKRLKIGDTVPLPQQNLPVLFHAHGTGQVTLVLLSIETINGHPCGVFSISGNYSSKNYQNVQGDKEDMEMTILSGKVWLSLLYPLVIQQELDTITTTSSSSDGGVSSRVQGNISYFREVAWKTLE